MIRRRTQRATVSASMTIEICHDDDGAVSDLSGREVPELVADYMRRLIPVGDCDLVIDFTAHLYYCPATWEQPEEGSDERYMDALYFEFGTTKDYPAIGREIFDAYADVVAEYELDFSEEGYEE